jgi:hypothetical protein
MLTWCPSGMARRSAPGRNPNFKLRHYLVVSRTPTATAAWPGARNCARCITGRSAGFSPLRTLPVKTPVMRSKGDGAADLGDHEMEALDAQTYP